MRCIRSAFCFFSFSVLPHHSLYDLYGIVRFKRCAGMSCGLSSIAAIRLKMEMANCCLTFFFIGIYFMYRFVATPNPNQLPHTLLFTLSTVHFNRIDSSSIRHCVGPAVSPSSSVHSMDSHYLFVFGFFVFDFSITARNSTIVPAKADLAREQNV